MLGVKFVFKLHSIWTLTISIWTNVKMFSFLQQLLKLPFSPKIKDENAILLHCQLAVCTFSNWQQWVVSATLHPSFCEVRLFIATHAIRRDKFAWPINRVEYVGSPESAASRLFIILMAVWSSLVILRLGRLKFRFLLELVQYLIAVFGIGIQDPQQCYWTKVSHLTDCRPVPNNDAVG